MALYRLPAEDWPKIAGWLDDSNSTPLGRQIVERAMRDVGILEVPLGSNRGTRIDRYTRRSGLEPPQWWCAIWVGAVYADCGCLVPRSYPSCDAWLPYLTDKPSIGAAILYGLKKKKVRDAHHIGIITRLEPMVLTIEGNRGYAGTTNNGVAVDIGPLQRRDILGYVIPKPVGNRPVGKL